MTSDNFFILASGIAEQLEGPYKWYVLATVAFILTGLVTRFIFKTLKWFILLMIILLCLIGFFLLAEELGAL